MAHTRITYPNKFLVLQNTITGQRENNTSTHIKKLPSKLSRQLQQRVHSGLNFNSLSMLAEKLIFIADCSISNVTSCRTSLADLCLCRNSLREVY